MKRNTLYTVNPWNKNLFSGGGNLWDEKYGDPNSKGGWFNMTKQSNPFSKGNINSTLSGLSTAFNPIITNAISGGYESAIGNGIASIGNTVSEFLPEGPWKWGVKLGSGFLGGVGNLFFGSSVDKKALNRMNEILNEYGREEFNRRWLLENQLDYPEEKSREEIIYGIEL